MYEHLRGKKLLIIGSDAGNYEIIHAAHEMGIYTIVADGITDWAKAPSKTVANEGWDIDYSDIDAMAKKCREECVNGVFAGYSEFRVLAACKIANALNLPFYGTVDQIELTRNKRRFKDECKKYDIPTPKDYCFAYPMTDEEKAKIEYPVIIKPADYAGRKGISVCHSAEKLEEALQYAVSKSQSRTVIVEDYLDGLEFSSVYTVVEGRISLSCVNEKFITDDQEVKSGLCEFLISPAHSYQRYLDELDEKVQSFIRGIGVKNGVVFFQGMITPKQIYVFEMGYRINGNNDFLVIEKFNGINFMKMMIAYSLCGSMCDDNTKDNPLYDKYACSMLFHAHAGVVGHMEYDALKSIPQIYDIQPFAWTGKEIIEDGSTGQKVLRFKIIAETIEELLNIVEFAQQNVIVQDISGANMLFKPFDAKCLLNK